MDIISFKPKALFIMKAYNTEKYIKKAIDSILGQTESNFLFLLHDNGSTDKTKDICRNYSESDKRIILYRNEINNNETDVELSEYKTKINDCLKKGTEYFAILDSDDYYHKDFLRVTYDVAKKNNADMVVCGSNFIDEKGINLLGNRIPPSLIINDKKLTENDYINLYGTLRPLWAKLYSCKIYDDYVNAFKIKPKEMFNGQDTFVVLTLMCKINNFVSIDKVLHAYRVRSSSVYHSNIDKFRIKAGDILFQKGIEFARAYEVYTPLILSFLYKVYYSHIKDLVDTLFRSTNLSIESKLDFLTAIMNEQNYFSLCNNFPKYKQYILDSVDRILEKVTPIERATAEEFYIVRLNSYYKNPNDGKNSEALLLSVYCDETNSCGWGSEKWNGISNKNLNYLINIVNKKITDEHNFIKEEMLKAIESNDWQRAIDKLNILSEDLPLSIDVLYFQMYYFYCFNDLENAIRISNIAKIFYGKNEDIINLTNKIDKLLDTFIEANRVKKNIINHNSKKKKRRKV